MARDTLPTPHPFDSDPPSPPARSLEEQDRQWKKKLDVTIARLDKLEAEHVIARIVEIERWRGDPPDAEDPDDRGNGVEGRLAMAERFIGTEGSAMHGRAPTGAHMHFAAIRASIDALTRQLEKDRDERERERLAHDAETKRLRDLRAPWSRAAWIAIGAVIVLVVGAVATGISTLIARHVRIVSAEPHEAPPKGLLDARGGADDPRRSGVGSRLDRVRA